MLQLAAARGGQAGSCGGACLFGRERSVAPPDAQAPLRLSAREKHTRRTAAQRVRSNTETRASREWLAARAACASPPFDAASPRSSRAAPLSPQRSGQSISSAASQCCREQRTGGHRGEWQLLILAQETSRSLSLQPARDLASRRALLALPRAWERPAAALEGEVLSPKPSRWHRGRAGACSARCASPSSSGPSRPSPLLLRCRLSSSPTPRRRVKGRPTARKSGAGRGAATRGAPPGRRNAAPCRCGAAAAARV
jgi:hypothetical protein